MRGPVVARVDPSLTLCEVAEELVADEIGAVLVDGPHGPAGVLSERDIITVLSSGGDPDVRQAAEVMSPDIVWGAPNESISAVARRMCDAGVRHIPIRDGATVVGVVSMRDVLEVLLDGTAECPGTEGTTP